MLRLIKESINNGQSRVPGNIRYTRHKTTTNKTNKHNAICVGHHYAQANTNNVNTDIFTIM